MVVYIYYKFNHSQINYKITKHVHKLTAKALFFKL